MHYSKCECDGEWTGERCEIDPCASGPCFRGVQCNSTDDNLNFTCGQCPIGEGAVDTVFQGDGRLCYRTRYYLLILLSENRNLNFIFKTIIKFQNNLLITAYDPCAIGNGHCNHLCRVDYTLPFPYKQCACHPYFTLGPDNRTCVNNICEERPDMCGDNTTVCTTIDTNDFKNELFKCGYPCNFCLQYSHY